MSEQIKDAAEAAAGSSVQCFGLEGWRAVSPDPVRAAFAEAGEGEDFADVVEKIGFGRWTHIGELAFASVPISIEVYARTASPEFLVNVVPNNVYTDRYVLADDLPSVMRLLAEWAPAAQGAAMVALVASAPSKVEKRLQGEVHVPDLQALLAKAGAEGAKKVVDALTETARQLGEIDQSLMRLPG